VDVNGSGRSLRRATMSLAAVIFVGACAGPLVQSVRVSGEDPPVQHGQYYFLPKAVFSVSIWGWASDRKDRFAVLNSRTLIADTRYFMRVQTNLCSSSHDIVTVSTDTKGLLARVEASSDEKSGEILVNLAKIAGSLMQARAAFAASAAGFTQRGTAPMRLATYVIDPSSEEGAATLEQIRQAHEVTISLRALSDCPGAVPLTPRTCAFEDTGVQTGVCFRPNLPYVLAFSAGGVIENKKVVAVGAFEQTVMMPNEGPIFCYPIERTEFVKRASVLTFTDGILTSAKTDKPSEALAFTMIPVNVLKEIIGIPASILDRRIEINQKTKTVAESEADALRALEALNEFIRARDAADGSPSGG
jgi:hypothetical protein